MEPPRTLSKELISRVVASYKETDSWRVHQLVFDMNFMHGFEEKIRDLIFEYTVGNGLPESTFIPQNSGHGMSSGSVLNTKHQNKSERRHGAKREDKDQCIVV
jgi:hypothetical protein